MKDYSLELDLYRQANAVSRKGGTVVLASGLLARMPISEMAVSAMLEGPVYSRSMPDLTVEDAGNMLDDCVFPLEPRQVIVALGSEEIKDPRFDLSDFIQKYEWLLYSINSHLKCRIYVVSVLSASPRADETNAALMNLANSCGCRYIDISRVGSGQNNMLRIFDILRNSLRSHTIGFAEAMSLPV